MTNKRPLTAEEKVIAKRLKSIIAADPNLTEESVGVHVGVSQGQISHWTNGRLAVPAARAVKLAGAMGISDPRDISLAYRRIAPTGVKESAGTYTTPLEQTVIELQTEIASMKAVMAVLLMVAAAHRPVEGVDFLRRLRKHLPAKMLSQGFALEITKSLAHEAPPSESADGPHQAGSTSR